jgi:hypothetical protein
MTHVQHVLAARGEVATREGSVQLVVPVAAMNASPAFVKPQRHRYLPLHSRCMLSSTFWTPEPGSGTEGVASRRRRPVELTFSDTDTAFRTRRLLGEVREELN